MVRVWIDTDIGDDIDDAVALLCAARHDQIDLVGVSTVGPWLDRRVKLAEDLLAGAGVEVPVLPGAIGQPPWSDAGSPASSYLTLAEGPVAPAKPEEDRIDEIAAAMEALRQPFDLVTIGPLTNVGRLLERHPEVSDTWSGVTCMAGRLEGEAEYNVRRDPDAARTGFAELTPHLVGLEASSNTLPRREVEVMLEGSDPASRLLSSYYRAYRGRCSWLQGPEESPLTLFDAITLLSLVRPEAFDFQQLSVLVERDGRLRLTDDGSPVTYALSSEWSALEPMLVGLLSGEGS